MPSAPVTSTCPGRGFAAMASVRVTACLLIANAKVLSLLVSDDTITLPDACQTGHESGGYPSRPTLCTVRKRLNITDRRRGAMKRTMFLGLATPLVIAALAFAPAAAPASGATSASTPSLASTLGDFESASEG